jgi:hypothetical protein
MRALADNDVLTKGSCYGLLRLLIGTVPGDGKVGILGTAKFVVPKTIKGAALRGDKKAAHSLFSEFAAENEIVEPSADEQEMAAIFEATAQDMALNLDVGESQLLALAISRCVPWLLTGDKRAIAAIEGILDSDKRLSGIAGKVKCLEQLVAALLSTGEADRVRRAICYERLVDKALSICFSCASEDADLETSLEGLTSYISDLRKSSSRVLAI